MCKTDPIRNQKDIRRLKEYFLEIGQPRNYAMVTLAMNTSLRISDILKLMWKDVFDFQTHKYKEHISLVEQKTKKRTRMLLNQEAQHSLDLLRGHLKEVSPEDYIFSRSGEKNHPICRSHAYKIIKKAGETLHIDGTISCHSLRKTFGYHAWKMGVQPALIMSIYNHSSIEITKRYLSIDQDDRDDVFYRINL